MKLSFVWIATYIALRHSGFESNDSLPLDLSLCPAMKIIRNSDHRIIFEYNASDRSCPFPLNRAVRDGYGAFGS